MLDLTEAMDLEWTGHVAEGREISIVTEVLAVGCAM